MSSLLPIAFVGFLLAGSAVALLVPSPALTRSQGVVVAARPTGWGRRGRRELELDIMVSRPQGGQFAIREIVLVADGVAGEFAPGAVVDICYRLGDESSVFIGHRRRRT